MFVVKLKRMAFVATRARHKRVAESVSVRRQSIESNPQLHTDNANNQRPASRLRRTGIDGRNRPLSRTRARQGSRHSRTPVGAERRPHPHRNHEGTRPQRERDLPDARTPRRAPLRDALDRRRPLHAQPQAVLARAPPSADEPADRRGVAADAAFRRCLRAIVSPVRLRSRQPARDRAGRRPGPWGVSVRLGSRVGPSIRHRGA